MSAPTGRQVTAAIAAATAAGTAAWLASRARQARALSESSATVLPPGRPATVRSADGTGLHVEEFGAPDAPPLVLVHAWMCSLELWHRQISALEGEARIIAFDLRGHGRSGLAPSADYSVEAFADDLQAVLADRLADGERAVLCGHSMGAMTIAGWGHRHSDEPDRRLAGVALVGTGMGDLISQSLVLRAPTRLSSVKEWIETAAISTEMPFDGAPELALQAAIRHLAFGPEARDEDVSLVARMVRACPRRVRGQSGGTLSRMDVFDGLASLDAPAAVIAGASDRMTPPIHSRKLAALLPRSPEVIEVPGVGHMVPLEAHETVTAELRGLLRGAAEPSRSAPATA